MADYRLTEPAERDLMEIATFIAEHDVAAAEHVVDSLEAALRGLVESPRKGHRRQDLTGEPGLLFWPVWQYLIVYRVDSDPLEISRILHGSRNVRSELEPE